MNARDYLASIRTIDKLIIQREEELKEIRSKITLISGIDYSRDRVQTSPKSGNGQIEKLVDLEADLAKMIDEQAARKHEIIYQIQQLKKPEHIDVLYRRYVKCEYFEMIAVNMGYSYSRVRHIHSDALKAFEEMFLKSDTR